MADIKPQIYYSKITQQWHWYWWYSTQGRLATLHEVENIKDPGQSMAREAAYRFINKLNAKQERLV